MKIYQIGDDEGEPGFVFSSKEAALAYAGAAAHVWEREVYDQAPPVRKYWARGAHVFPDKTFEEWTVEHEARGEITIPPCKDSQPWLVGCGEHISLHGTDRTVLESTFQTLLALVRDRQIGTCVDPYHVHRGAIDGRTVFEHRFMQARRAITGEEVILSCWPYAEHDYGAWSDWLWVDAWNWNRHRICQRCVWQNLECYYSHTSDPPR